MSAPSVSEKQLKKWYAKLCPKDSLKPKDEQGNFITALYYVIKHGQLYESGAQRYPESGSAWCDLCKATVKTMCYGLGSYDVCIECAEKLTD